MYYLIGFGILLLFYFILRSIKLNNKKKAVIKAAQEVQKEKLRGLLPKAEDFLEKSFTFLKREEYISNYQLYHFKEEYQRCFEILVSIGFHDLPNFEKEIEIFSSFFQTFSDLPKSVEDRNKLFVETELERTENFFNNIEGNSLDNQQRRAVIINEDNNIVIAGAGSGKTTTIAGKVKYLLEKCNYKKDEILLISFTRKAADEMYSRISEKMGIKIPVKTFHKLGLEIIAETQNSKPSILDLNKQQAHELLEDLLSTAKIDSQYYSKLTDFVSFYLRPYKKLEDFSTEGEYTSYLKEQKFYGYNMVNLQNGKGVFRERFKSQEETLIANFLFRNRVNYRYEEPYKYKTASKKFGQYKPDFYLPDFDIYIEHFGIDENGKVPDWFRSSQGESAQEKYTNGISWKRSEHQRNGTTLIETYSYQQKRGILLEKLEEKLLEKGVTFNPMTDEEFWNFLLQNHPKEISDLTQLFYSFLVLLKSNNLTTTAILERAEKQADYRAIQFLEVFEPISNLYQEFLDSRKEIDFSDMINHAIKVVKNHEYSSPYKYIIIDEFQDISQSRFELIKALLDDRPETKLFCVGDDWQSIYRFTGSDIGIFTEFEKKFESSSLKGFHRKTEKLFIEKTYRFNQNLIELSSVFILKNPNQIPKTLISGSNNSDEVLTIKSYNGEHHFLTQLEEILQGIIKQSPNQTSILLLGRYNYDGEVLLKSRMINRRYDSDKRKYQLYLQSSPTIEFNFMTVHSAKGLEADHVIIINGKGGTYGFPSEVADDPLLHFLLSNKDRFPNGEERRLFYVALTRAKKQVHILKDSSNPSKFIQEIDIEEDDQGIKCDWCENGKLIRREGPYGAFFACDNYGYCNYTISEENFNNEQAHAFSSIDSDLEVDNII